MFQKSMKSKRLEIRLDKMSIAQLEQFVSCIVRNSCQNEIKDKVGKSKKWSRDVTNKYPLTRARTTGSNKWRETLLNVVARCTNRSKECVLPQKSITRNNKKPLTSQSQAKQLPNPTKTDFLNYFKLSGTQNYSIVVNNNVWKGHHPLHLLNTHNVPFSSDLGQKLTKDCHHVPEEIHQRKIERIERYLTTVINPDTFKLTEYEVSYNKTPKNQHTYVFPTKIHRKRGRLSSKATFLLVNHCRPCTIKLENLRIPENKDISSKLKDISGKVPNEISGKVQNNTSISVQNPESKVTSRKRCTRSDGSMDNSGKRPQKYNLGFAQRQTDKKDLFEDKIGGISGKNETSGSFEEVSKSGTSDPLDTLLGKRRTSDSGRLQDDSGMNQDCMFTSKNQLSQIKRVCTFSQTDDQVFHKTANYEFPQITNLFEYDVTSSIIKKENPFMEENFFCSSESIVPQIDELSVKSNFTSINEYFPGNGNYEFSNSENKKFFKHLELDFKEDNYAFEKSGSRRSPITRRLTLLPRKSKFDVFKNDLDSNILGKIVPQESVISTNSNQKVPTATLLSPKSTAPHLPQIEIVSPNSAYSKRALLDSMKETFVAPLINLKVEETSKKLTLIAPKTEPDVSTEPNHDSTPDPLKFKENYSYKLLPIKSIRENFMVQSSCNKNLVPINNCSAILKQNNSLNGKVEDFEELLGLSSNKIESSSEISNSIKKSCRNRVKRNKVKKKKVIVYETRSSVRILRVRVNGR